MRPIVVWPCLLFPWLPSTESQVSQAMGNQATRKTGGSVSCVVRRYGRQLWIIWVLRGYLLNGPHDC